MKVQRYNDQERRILFTVWDNNNDSVVNLVGKNSDDVIAEGFCGKGTGAHA